MASDGSPVPRRCAARARRSGRVLQQRVAGLGDQFLLEVLECLQRVKHFPEAGHPFTPDSRRWRTRRFPYGITYQILESEVLVVSLAHLHRRPGYLLSRIREQVE